MHIVLYKPDIPQNTAAIIRLSACLNLSVHIIEPCGFNLSDKRFKRVVMDYMGLSRISRYNDYETFLEKHKKSRIMLLFGRESSGVPENLHKTIKNKVKIPMNKKTRSLNIGMSVAIIASEALRQNNLL